MAVPSVGRIVRYVQSNGKKRPAIIVEVLEDEKVDLRVFRGVYPQVESQEQEAVTAAPHDERCLEGTWHWPERTP